MKGKRILVTGAGGFIGSRLAQALFKSGNFVRAVDVKWGNVIDEPYYSELMTLDLRIPENALKAMQDIDLVFNLAAKTGGSALISNIEAEVMSYNQRINLNMLEASVKSNIDRFFFSSSASVYPRASQDDSHQSLLKESDAIPANPDTFYGWEKLLMEKECEAYARDYGLKTRIARFFFIYGEEYPKGSFIKKVHTEMCNKVLRAKNGDSIKISGHDDQTRSLLYISDCIDGVISLMQSNYKEPINIGSDKPIKMDDLANLVISFSGKKLSKKEDLSGSRGFRGKCADTTLAKKVLGWYPKISLEEGMKRTYLFVEKQFNQEP